MRSSSPRSRTLYLLPLLAASFAFSTHIANAQRKTSPRTLVALADSLPEPSAKAVLLFRSRPTGDHVVLLPRDAPSPEALGAALALLPRLEKQHASDSDFGVIPIQAFLTPANLAATKRAEWRALIDEARRQPRTRIGNLGQGQWAVVAQQ